MHEEIILATDDNRDDLLTLKDALRRARILNRVEAVGNADDTICYLKGEGAYKDRVAYPSPILLLLDLKMPGRSGFDVLAWLKEHPRYRPTAVVILAGVDSMEEIRRAYRLGVNSFLTKPLVVEDLMNALKGLHGVEIALEQDGCRLQPAGKA